MWSESDLARHRAKEADRGNASIKPQGDGQGDLTLKEKALYANLADLGLPMPYREWQFHHERRWKVDYCFPQPEMMIALEVEGGVWTRGGHTRGSGFMSDVEKYNALACHGYKLIRCTPSTLADKETARLIKTASLS